MNEYDHGMAVGLTLGGVIASATWLFLDIVVGPWFRRRLARHQTVSCGYIAVKRPEPAAPQIIRCYRCGGNLLLCEGACCA